MAPYGLGVYQVDNIKTVLAVGKALRAPNLALLAMLCLGAGENDFTADGCNSSNHCGFFQLSSTLQAEHDYHDVAYWAERAYRDGFYSYGGLIPIAQAQPTLSPGTITNMCQGAYSDLTQGGAYYDQYLSEAKVLLTVYGGVSSASLTGTGAGGSPSASAGTKAFTFHTQDVINAIQDDDWSPWVYWADGYLYQDSLLGYRASQRATGNCKGMSVFTTQGGR